MDDDVIDLLKALVQVPKIQQLLARLDPVLFKPAR